MKKINISKLDVVANTDRYIFYMPALSDKFAVFLSDAGQTYNYKEATNFRLEEAYKFRINWEAANPNKGHLIMLDAYDNYPTVEVIPVGHLDAIVNDLN